MNSDLLVARCLNTFVAQVQKELKPLLREYGLRISGTKQELVDRIMEHELQLQGRIPPVDP